MSVTVTRQLPLVASDGLYDFIGTGDPSTSPGVFAAIGSRFSATGGGVGVTLFVKTGAGDTDWSATLGGSSGGGSGVGSVTGATGISASPTTGAVVVSPTYGVLANTVAQGNDARFLSTVEKTDLTDGGDTTLHKHDGRYYTETEVDALLAALPGSGGVPTHAWQPMTITVAGIVDLLYDSNDELTMIYAPI